MNKQTTALIIEERQDILECLYTRKLMQGITGGLHLGYIFDANIHHDYETGEEDHSAATKAVADEKAARERGEKYFGDGYRLKSTARGIYSDHNDIDEEYLYCRRVTAGWLASMQAYRMQYIVKI